MPKRIFSAIAIALLAAASIWYWGPGKETAAPPTGLACHTYTEPKKAVPADLSIPVLKDKGAPVYKVVEVIDGDTLTVQRSGSEKLKVRLLGMDTPEKSSTRFGHPEVYGEEAYRYAQARIRESGTEVRLTYDGQKKDIYGRDLAYVWLKDGRLLNAMLVADGYAYYYNSSPKPEFADRFLALMRDARTRQRGLWSACQ